MYVLLVFVFSAIRITVGDFHISDDDYALLPPIFSIDPFDKCIKENKTFCRLHLMLQPLNIENPSKIWKIIEETKVSKRHYNHDELYHAVCVNDSFSNNINMRINKTALNAIVSRTYNIQYSIRGLKTTLLNSDCQTYKYHTNTFDIAFLVVVLLYCFIIVIATCYHFAIKNHENGQRYLILFSIYYNSKKLLKSYRQEDGKLKHIQGIRFYTTVLIIFCHTFCSFAGAYIANTKYFEDIPLNFFRHSIRNLFVFLVQTFFLISAWLLSYHTFTIFKYTQNVNVFKYVFVTFFNRYLRIIPPVLLMISLGRTGWIYGYFSGPLKEIYSDVEYQRCRRNWWLNLLFLSNHFKQFDMCYITSWYLSADTQLYLLSLIWLVTVIKLTKHRTFFMLLSLILSIILPSVISYWYNLDVIFRITPENLKNGKFLTLEFNASYTSTYSNMATYILGLIFGYVYFHLENKSLFTSSISRTFWWISTVGLPLMVIFVSSYEYSRITSAILGGVLRPAYALGIGIGIFGMSQKIGGFLQKLCEWKPVIFLGNFTYSTYVVHFGIVFYRTALATTPIQISDYILFTSFVQDTIFSFICGFVLHLILEMPAAELQHMLVYKFSTNKFKSSCKVK